jgi:peroxisomal membrane protein 4
LTTSRRTIATDHLQPSTTQHPTPAQTPQWTAHYSKPRSAPKHQTTTPPTLTLQAALERIILDPQYHDILAVLKGARNGAVYGCKVRFPHALVYVLLSPSPSSCFFH